MIGKHKTNAEEELQIFGGGGGGRSEVFSSSPLHPCFPLLSLFSSFLCRQTQRMLLFFYLRLNGSSPILLLFIAYHLEKGLQQPVVSVPVGLASVEAVGVVAVDIVLGASELVDGVQSLVQRLRGQPCRRTADLVPPGGRRPDRRRVLRGRALAVEGRLEEAQQGRGGGGRGV